MDRFEAAVRMSETEAIRSLDLSMFDLRDIANICLQRPEVLADIPERRDILRSWVEGDDRPLMRTANRYMLELVSRAIGFILLEYRELRPLFHEISPERIADIGCGYGILDLFLHADLGMEMLLIDTEYGPERHLWYQPVGSGCSNLDVARRFLVANGCDAAKLRLLNPRQESVMEAGEVDLAVSFLSCGYLYPADTYARFLRERVRPGGSVLLDIRATKAPEVLRALVGLGRFSRVGTVAGGLGLRLQIQRPAASAVRAA
ncbi:class I SAM-dependent methyltransferase [Pseudoruegeria sp. HB172150]|uniref:class I SAM-dependent methyltransferase n=1 Tax=Pseudoruegeria sp. HB172150 TaxID=2721164 RepID=UPI0015568C35|nr:class I SAM-dependent methyltransferase [Pseudoruegeria sp. HB172150]